MAALISAIVRLANPLIRESCVHIDLPATFAAYCRRMGNSSTSVGVAAWYPQSWSDDLVDHCTRYANWKIWNSGSDAFFAVGTLVPHTEAAVGAVATQALINPFFGVNGLRLLRDGIPAADVVARLIASDEGQAHRQVHVMDAGGHVAVHTGKACTDWCGAIAEPNLSVAGNMLANENVIKATAKMFLGNAKMPFAQRLIVALKAGETAGGDKRGRQSAALRIQGEEDWPDLDLRVDDHTDPLAEIERLEKVSRERFVHFMKFLPNRAHPAGTTDRAVIESGIQEALAAQEKS